ncbi:Nucleoporin nup85 [Nowakowskiella sp. JEL0407]|nr:Nucleoporin nup85 [Nowakowskiella sp. JEL0407]
MAEVAFLGICPNGGIDQLLAQNRTLRGTLSPVGCNVTVFPCAKNVVAHSKYKSLFDQDTTLSIYQWHDIPNVKLEFIKETFAIFTKLNKLNESEIDRELLTRTFEQYRHQINLMVNQTKNLSSSTFETYSMISSVWHMSEILFTNGANEPIGEKLMEWLNQHDAIDQNRVQLIANKKSERYTHPDFWPVLFNCTIRFDFAHAITMLKELPAYYTNEPNDDQNIPSVLINFMETIPRWSSFQTSAEYQSENTVWRERIQHQAQKLNQLGLDVEFFEEYLKVLCILYGDEETILSTSETWMESIAAIAFFSRPESSCYDIQGWFEFVEDKINRDSNYELMIESLLKFDITSALSQSVKVDGWLVSHLSDLLEKVIRFGNGMITMGTEWTEITNSDQKIKMRDWFLANYAIDLASNEELWMIALDYFALCGRYGRKLMETYVVRVPIEHAEKAIEYCDRMGMNEQAKSIHSILAHSYYKSNNYPEAISHYSMAGEHKRISIIVEKVFEEFRSTGDIAPVTQLMQSLPSNVADDKLIFLLHYCEFFENYQQKNFEAAAEKLILLITSNKSPDQFKINLILDALPLLLIESFVFKVEDTYELMRCLEDVLEIEEHKDLKKFELLRFALLKNLAKAIALNN